MTHENFHRSLTAYASVAMQRWRRCRKGGLFKPTFLLDDRSFAAGTASSDERDDAGAIKRMCWFPVIIIARTASRRENPGGSGALDDVTAGSFCHPDRTCRPQAKELTRSKMSVRRVVGFSREDVAATGEGVATLRWRCRTKWLSGSTREFFRHPVPQFYRGRVVSVTEMELRIHFG